MQRINDYLVLSPEVCNFEGNLPAPCKILCGQIKKYSKKTGDCRMLNITFGKLNKVTPRTIQRWLHTLKESQLISVEYANQTHPTFEGGGNRKIKLVVQNNELTST